MAFGQTLTDNMLPFGNEIDSVVVRAAKSGIRKLEITITPYEGTRQFPHDFRPGDTIPVTWTKKEKNTDDFFYEESSEWTFLNDSLFRVQVGGETQYGLIRNGILYEYNRKKKTIYSVDNTTLQDSAGWIIRENTRTYGIKSNYVFFLRQVINPSGHIIDVFRSESGYQVGEFWGSGVVYYSHYSYSGDSIVSSKSYWLHYPDTIHSIAPDKILSSKGKTTYHDTLIIRQAPDTMLVADYYCHRSIAPDHRSSCDTTITGTYEFYTGKPSAKTTTVTKAIYVYDQNGRMIRAEAVDSNCGNPYWKTEMIIIYKD